MNDCNYILYKMDLQLFINSLQKTGIEISQVATNQKTIAISCCYKNNPDGSIRWIWPKSAKRPYFLKFYHSSGLKAQLINFALNAMGYLGLLKWFANGSFTIYTSVRNKWTISESWKNKWAWFAGTIGPNQKAILWCKADKKSTFVKIPLSKRAEENAIHEANTLQLLQNRELDYLCFPTVKLNESNALYLSDVSKATLKTNRLSELPINALQQWLIFDKTIEPFHSSAFCSSLNQKLKLLNDVADTSRIPKLLIEKLNLLDQGLVNNNFIKLAFSHGDFTPWNVMFKENTLHLIDLELAQQKMPILFDLFHYIYQSNILNGNHGYASVRKEIDQLFDTTIWKNYINEQNIDVVLAERLYLLYSIANYSIIYHEQEQWHIQITWLLNTWNTALTDHLIERKIKPIRVLMLEDLSFYLKQKSYAILKWQHQEIGMLPENSDLDICIDYNDALSVIALFKNNPLITNLSIKKLSFMFQLSLFLKDGTNLSVDFIYKFKRKSQVFLDANELLLNSFENSAGLKVPNLADDWKYVQLFFGLNNAPIPEKYQQHANQIPLSQLLKGVKKLKANHGFNKVANQLGYVFDVLKEFFQQSGFIVSFSGVDGAGKSTIIEHTRNLVDKRMRNRVVVVRHRPGLFPILSAFKHGKVAAQNIAAANLPRQGTNNGLLSSVLRFSYYYLDYLLGQWYINFRYLKRGYIVLYDRYYFDFINDGKRSNINLPTKFTSFLYKFIAKPELNFFLFADHQTILKRKQELDAPTISALTEKYLSLFDKLSISNNANLYLPIENIELDTTLNIVFNHIKNKHNENHHPKHS